MAPWKGRVCSSGAIVGDRREGRGRRGARLGSCLESLERPRASTSAGNFIPGRLVSRARLSCLRFLFLAILFSVPDSSPSPPCFLPSRNSFTRRSRPWRVDRHCPCLRSFSAFAIRPLSPSRFLPPLVSPRARYSPDRERKSSELNEYRAPLEGSLSMSTRKREKDANIRRLNPLSLNARASPRGSVPLRKDSMLSACANSNQVYDRF